MFETNNYILSMIRQGGFQNNNYKDQIKLKEN